MTDTVREFKQGSISIRSCMTAESSCRETARLNVKRVQWASANNECYVRVYTHTHSASEWRIGCTIYATLTRSSCTAIVLRLLYSASLSREATGHRYCTSYANWQHLPQLLSDRDTLKITYSTNEGQDSNLSSFKRMHVKFKECSLNHSHISHAMTNGLCVGTNKLRNSLHSIDIILTRSYSWVLLANRFHAVDRCKHTDTDQDRYTFPAQSKQ